jgi:predicted phage terminase large subunit-like protein
MSRLPIETVEDLAVEMASKYNPDGIVVETNNFQILVAKNIQRKLKALKVLTPIYRHVNTENKEVRLRMGLTPLFHNHKIKLKDIPHNKIAFQQIRDFPTSKYDDALDSLHICTCLVQQLLRAKDQRKAATLLRV